MIRLALGLCIAVTAAAQQPITHSPALLQSGSPVFFCADLPQAVSLKGTWLSHPVTFTHAADGTWFLLAGIDVEQPPGTYTLALTETLIDSSTKSIATPVTVSAASYRSSKIEVPGKFLAPDAETQARIEREAVLKKEAFATNTSEVLWHGNFAAPVPFSPTDSFGTRRTFNGTLASIHKGTDFHASTGTPVYAANDGVVLIAQPMFYEGNFVLLDHGLAFMTMYMHFSRIDVHAGDHIRKGQQLGLSGATGRVTGPHLHFAARWQGAYIDPVKLFALNLP